LSEANTFGAVGGAAPRLIQLALLLAVGCSSTPKAGAPAPVATSACAEIRFTKQDYMDRTGFNFGDSWMMTWGDDGKTYTNFSDGKVAPGDDKPSNALLEITGDPPNLKPESFVAISEDPLRREASWSHYIISTIAVGGVLYVGHVNLAVGAEMASGIARSDDRGETLIYDRAAPMWPARETGVRFVYPSFLQNGRGYRGNRDGFMYVYGSDGEWGKKNSLRLARAPLERLLDIRAYRYWAGDGRWSAKLDEARDVLIDVEGGGTNLGGMQSIAYNPALDRYFLITFGEPFTDRARMVLYDAPQPWGPWTLCGRPITADQALFKEGKLFTKLYNPSFNAKWIEADGSMWISYSNYTPQYSFHYGKIEVVRR
jgi:hypothetical protein